MTKNPEIKVIKNLEDGDTIEVQNFCIYEDDEKDVTILSIMDSTGEVFACQSSTFRSNFLDIADIYDGETFTIKKISGKTKAGRDYINCTLAM